MQMHRQTNVENVKDQSFAHFVCIRGYVYTSVGYLTYKLHLLVAIKIQGNT